MNIAILKATSLSRLYARTERGGGGETLGTGFSIWEMIGL